MTDDERRVERVRRLLTERLGYDEKVVDRALTSLELSRHRRETADIAEAKGKKLELMLTQVFDDLTQNFDRDGPTTVKLNYKTPNQDLVYHRTSAKETPVNFDFRFQIGKGKPYILCHTRQKFRRLNDRLLYSREYSGDDGARLVLFTINYGGRDVPVPFLYVAMWVEYHTAVLSKADPNIPLPSSERGLKARRFSPCCLIEHTIHHMTNPASYQLVFDKLSQLPKATAYAIGQEFNRQQDTLERLKF
jgi:hypothetical protein